MSMTMSSISSSGSDSLETQSLNSRDVFFQIRQENERRDLVLDVMDKESEKVRIIREHIFLIVFQSIE